MKKSVIDVYMDIARKNPPWSKEEEINFVKSCISDDGKWASGSDKDRFVNEAMKHNIGLVFSLVDKMAFRKSEDLIQKAVIAMVASLKKYNPKKGCKISTWITNPIKWSIMQYHNVYARNGTIAEEISSVGKKMNVNMSVVSIESEIGEDEDGDTIENVLSVESLDKNYTIERRINDNKDSIAMEAKDGIGRLMENIHTILNEKEQYVVRRFLDGMNQTEISVEMKLSKMRIYQLQDSAFRKIRNSPMAKHLKMLLK